MTGNLQHYQLVGESGLSFKQSCCYFIKKVTHIRKIFWPQLKYVYVWVFLNILSPFLGILTEIFNFLFNSFTDNRHPNYFLLSPQELYFLNHVALLLSFPFSYMRFFTNISSKLKTLFDYYPMFSTIAFIRLTLLLRYLKE